MRVCCAQGFVETIKHAQTVKFCSQAFDAEDVELFCSQELALPQVNRFPSLAVVKKSSAVCGSYVFALATTHAILLIAKYLSEVENTLRRCSVFPLAFSDIGTYVLQYAGVTVLPPAFRRMGALTVLMVSSDTVTSNKSTDWAIMPVICVPHDAPPPPSALCRLHFRWMRS